MDTDNLVKGGQGRTEEDMLDYCSLIRFCLYCAAGCILFVRFFA